MASAINQILKLQRAQLQGVIELRGVKRMLPLYKEAAADLERRLRAMGKDKTFTAHHLRITLAQLKEAIFHFQDSLAGHMTKEGRLAGTLGGRHLVKAVQALEKHFSGHTPVLQVEQAGVFRQLYKGVEPSLLDKFKKSSRLYGQPVVSKIRNKLALSMLQNEDVGTAVNRVMETFDGERWRAERIVRTEMSYSYGVVKQKYMEEMRRVDVPDLQKKLIATFDTRTGEDSKELHGQVKPVDKPFEWITSKGEKKLYMQPPNRPNDREIVIPWRGGWENSDVTRPGGDGPGAVAPALTGTAGL